MPTLADALTQTDHDTETLALIVGVSADEVAGWVTTGQIPDEHLQAVVDLLGPIDPPAPSGNTDKRTNRRKPTRRKATAATATAEVTAAVTLCATLATASPSQQQLAAAIAKEDHDLTAEGLRDLTLRWLNLPKATSEALQALRTLTEITNPFRVGAALGQYDRRQLTEVYRLAQLLTGQDGEQPLPAGDDAVVAVAETVGQLAGSDPLGWLPTS